MRGSPLIRSIFLALALVATGAGLARITAAKGTEIVSAKRAASEDLLTAGSAVPFRVLLSHPAATVELVAKSEIRLAPTGNFFTGTMEMDPQNPRFSIKVHWALPSAPGEHRFAKITLEPPGRETFTHVFDSVNGIDELLELPSPVAP